ncbi:MAG: type II secretion system secretin GspD [Myxococcota bacterium]
MKKHMCRFLALIFFSLTVSAQQQFGPLPDDELPIAPLRGEDIPPPPRPMGRDSGRPARSAQRNANNNDIAKVVPTKCVRPKGKFPWNLEKAKLSDLVDQVSRLTCRNFIIASGVKPSQEISIISRTPITVDQAWQAFQSTLEANELSLFKTGDYYKIIKRVDSPRQPIPVVDEKATLPNDEGMVTYLYDLKHLTKDVGQSLVKGLISRVGDVIVVGETFLVITDGSSNIRRVMKILAGVDVSGAANRIHIVDLVHADAVQIQTKLNDIFTGGKSNDNSRPRSPYDDFGPPRARGAAAGENFSLQKMIADERTNKLIIISSDKAFDRIKDMIDVLDVPSSGASSKGEIYVYHLKNGDSKKIAATLTALLQGVKSGRAGSQPGNFGREEVLEGDTKISADEATNSLVIVASPRDYKTVVKVIAKLDRKRIQIYVEAAIMEITVSDNKDYGVGAFGAIPVAGAGVGILATGAGEKLAKDMFTAIGASLAPNGGGATAAAAQGLAPFLSTLGFVGSGQTLNLNGQTITVPGVGAILKLAQQYSNADILSTPSLMTLDNEKAEMSVGQRIPTISGASTMGLGTGAGGIGIPLQNVKYEEPKLKFTITPHVNDDNMVRMEIEQDVSDVGEQVQLLGSTQYKFSTKTAKTIVSAKDQQTIVLGGLISESYSTSETKVPFLGDIPILGHLFKTTSKVKFKKNLMLVLTPYVIRDDADLRKIYDRKSQEREEFGKLYFGNKITTFDPHVDYEKKVGPVTALIDQVKEEMAKTENGGPGLPGETLIEAPAVHDDLEKHKVQTLDSSLPVEAPPSETPAPTPLQPTETVIIDQPPMQLPEPAPIPVTP